MRAVPILSAPDTLIRQIPRPPAIQSALLPLMYRVAVSRSLDDLAGVMPATSPRVEILRTARLLIRCGDVHEVRILHAGKRHTISGYFDDPEVLADAVLSVDGTVPAVYITLNPVAPELLARSANCFESWARVTTVDTDIVRRRWLLIDFDPVRKSGISSTDQEHGRAITAALAAWDILRRAFGNPVVADSGNGAHLLYRLDLPNDDNATAMIKHILAGVAARCSTDNVDVDQKVFNPARITKLYGTMACKGSSIPDRPHRRSRLLEIPQKMHILEVA
jgi:hypothetical protein